MKTLRILALTSLVTGFGLMTSCDSTSSTGDAPSITSALYVSDHKDDIATFEFAANTKYHLAGTVKNVSSWAWTIENSSGTKVETIVADAPSGSGSTDIGSGSAKLVEFVPKSAWGGSGTYTIKGVLTGTDGSTLTTKISFKAAPGGTTGTPTNLTANGAADVGAQGADPGSFLSIIGGWSMTSGAKTLADEDSVDVVFFADGSNVPTFYSPAKAFSLTLGNLSGWTTRHSTIIVKSTTALTTVEQVQALTTGSSSQSALVAADGWYAVKLDNGKYGALHVTAFNNAGRSATATISVFNN